jgi:hypothetical protein
MGVSAWWKALLVTSAGLGMAVPAWACALDNRPSMSADGVLAHLTAAVPTAATLPTWASFTFPRVYKPGQPVRFSEDQAEVRRTLTPSALSHPWRWNFGDGSTAVGYNVQHG